MPIPTCLWNPKSKKLQIIQSSKSFHRSARCNVCTGVKERKRSVQISSLTGLEKDIAFYFKPQIQNQLPMLYLLKTVSQKKLSCVLECQTKALCLHRLLNYHLIAQVCKRATNSIPLGIDRHLPSRYAYKRLGCPFFLICNVTLFHILDNRDISSSPVLNYTLIAMTYNML